MTEKKMVHLQVDEDITFFISDILCWFTGYIEGKESGDSQILLDPAINKLRKLNNDLKEILL